MARAANPPAWRRQRGRSGRICNRLLYSTQNRLPEENAAMIGGEFRAARSRPETSLFNFESELRRKSIPAARQAARQSLEQKQRDAFESHRHRAFSLAFYMTGNELEAEQILTQTFVHAFEQEEQPDGPGVDAALMEQLFERFPSMRKPAPPEAPSSMHGLGIGSQQVLRTDLEIAIRSLPPVERLLFLLRDVEGYTVDAAGTLLGLSRSRTETALFSARLHLRQSLAAVPGRSSEAA